LQDATNTTYFLNSTHPAVTHGFCTVTNKELNTQFETNTGRYAPVFRQSLKECTDHMWRTGTCIASPAARLKWSEAIRTNDCNEQKMVSRKRNDAKLAGTVEASARELAAIVKKRETAVRNHLFFFS
jgi:hypothetical protein